MTPTEIRNVLINRAQDIWAAMVEDVIENLRLSAEEGDTRAWDMKFTTELIQGMFE